MEVLFFNNIEGKILEDWTQVSETSFLGGGRFSKQQMNDLFQCFDLTAEHVNDHLWRLSQSSTNKIACSSDETLKELGVSWATSSSWGGSNVNGMDLSGHLLELKHSYLSQSNQNGIWLLFG